MEAVMLSTFFRKHITSPRPAMQVVGGYDYICYGLEELPDPYRNLEMCRQAHRADLGDWG